jgi:hypothetical protein
MRSLHEVHEISAYSAGLVCPSVRQSVRMIELYNSWSDLDEISYGLYAIGVYSKLVLAHWMGQSPRGGAESERATAVGCLGGPVVMRRGVTGV